MTAVPPARLPDPATFQDVRELAHMLPRTQLHVDQGVPFLVECAIRRDEGILAENGAMCVRTGERTGRSPKDRFIVDREDISSQIDWGPINQPFDEVAFEKLWSRVLGHLSYQGELFVSHLRAGADPENQVTLRVVTEYAWHALFARQLFIRPPHADLSSSRTDWTILSAPSFKAEPRRDSTLTDGAVILDLSGHRILLCGMQYAGAMKKSVFTVLNHLLPALGVLPMHCAANVGEDGDVALFFGLSGTGKTTLSADPERFLVGDDEHGWNDNGIFNFEGGCYAKCIKLTPEREPIIWNAIRFGSVVENVVLRALRRPDYDDDSITQNTRAAYPREFVDKRMPGNRAGHPRSIIFLTCDLYGVLPPVASLTKEQAAYHFLAGYTALVGSTEVGQAAEIKPTFSACFGAPFFPRRAQEYAELLMDKIDRHGSGVYLVNTGWTGGAYARGGQRFSIATTPAIVHAVLRGELVGAEMDHLEDLNLRVPRYLPGIDTRILNPRHTWHDQQAYDQNKRELIQRFVENMDRFDLGPEIRTAGPRIP